MDSVNQARSQAWRLWTKLAAPALLRSPVLGISTVLAISTPIAAMARTLPRAQETASAEPTHQQMRVLTLTSGIWPGCGPRPKGGRAVKFAYRQVGKPYQWGGAGPRTYDCSGLVMAAWRKGGLRLPHRADLQHRTIRRKVGIKRLRPGDLVFFSGDHHVGIYVGRRHFLHAPHTGSRVQRGTLTGWRLRSFAGAARPGAPAYHAWPHWVRASPTTPTDIEAPAPAARTCPGGLPVHRRAGRRVDGRGDPAGVRGRRPGTRPGHGATRDERARAGRRDGAATGVRAIAGSKQLPVRVLTMAAPSRERHHHAYGWSDTGPTPQAQNGQARPPWPGATVQQQNDEQKFDRVYDGRGDNDDEDGDLGNDGIDLRSLLGGAP